MNDLNRNLTVLYSKEQILQKIDEVAHHLNQKYQNTTKPVVVVGILKGCVVFLGQLLTKLTFDTEVDFFWASSYYGTESKELKVRADLTVDITGRDVLIVEDILDTGQTLHVTTKMLKERNPASLYTVVMVAKEKEQTHPFTADYALFKTGNKWVVGYGFDTDGQFSVPYIATVEPQ